MASPKELDLFKRSRSGDWESRIQIFKRYIWENSRVRRLGAPFSNLEDFLHDCLTNVLRTGHAFDPEKNLNNWVESVAAWTALDRLRQREPEAGKTQRIRLCAAPESDEPEGRSRLTGYAPPYAGPDDSPRARIRVLVGEPQFTLLSNRTPENSTWEEVAAAAGKPLNTVGPILVRTIDRLVRFFGAPPPLNADLEPVLVWMVRQDASTSGGDPGKPKGRIVSMQTDPSFYAVTPEMRKIGLSVPSEVRTISLWDAARSSKAPAQPLRDHLAKCRYCADVLRGLLRMQQALASETKQDFLLCPGGYTLMETPSASYEALDEHLEACALCRAERQQLMGSGEGNGGTGSAAKGMSRARVAGGAVVLLLFGIGGYCGYRATHKTENQAITLPPAAAPAPKVVINPRYSGLAEPIPLNDPRWIDSVLPQNRQEFNDALDQAQSGGLATVRIRLSGLADTDPGAEMLTSAILYRQGDTNGGYQAMLKSEAMPPRKSFRCWSMLQCAILVGDLDVARREVDHLSQDPAYAAKAKDLLARALARK